MARFKPEKYFQVLLFISRRKTCHHKFNQPFLSARSAILDTPLKIPNECSMPGKIAIASILLLFTAGCGHLYPRRLSENFSPKKNDNPVKLIHISGKKSPSLSISITTAYMSTNEECNRLTNWPMTISSARSVRVSETAHEAMDDYDVVIPLDRFEVGTCNWLPFSIDYSISKSDIPFGPSHPSPMVWITKIGNKNIGFATHGVDSLPEFDISCHPYPYGGRTSISCNSPSDYHEISDKTQELRINFIERN